jgi:hypothetical protein
MNIALSGLIYGGVLVVMMLVARDGVVGLLGSLSRALITRLRNTREKGATYVTKTRPAECPVGSNSTGGLNS